jgi:hypothetical protein
MTPNTHEDVSDAELTDMLSWFEQEFEADPDACDTMDFWLKESDVKGIASALRELQRHRARTGYDANCQSCTCAFPSEGGR